MEQKALTGYPSIDKPWLKYYSEEAINAPLPGCTVYENIKNNNIESPNDIALQYFSNKITYKTLFANVEKVKNALVANGVKKGDKIIMFTSSTPELIYVVLALGRTGDIGYITEDGFITILGRANDTFKAKSGEVLFCFDIENEIIKDRNVALCEVVGIPGTGYEVPVAHIVLEKNCSLSEQEVITAIHNACVSRLSE